MTKTLAHLWPQVTSWENLLVAYRKCRRRKRYKTPACRFDFAWEQALLELQRDLTSGAYRHGPYRHFYVHEPKRRKISAAPFRDRVVHHALVNVLEPIFEKKFVFDSYACRRGKGTHRAIRRAQAFLRRHEYYCQTDIVRFFPNIDHGVLMELLKRTIRDRHVLGLIERILASGEDVLRNEATPSYFSGDDLLAVLRPRGLPIGNLTSQFFANVFLDPIDHFIKEQLRVPGYVRYADDLLLFGPSKEFLWDRRERLSERLAQLRLRLHRDKTVIRPARCGLQFLGFKVFPDTRRLTQDGLRRFNRHLRRLRWLYQNGLVSFEFIRASLRAWTAHAQHANSTAIRRHVWRRVRFTRQRTGSFFDASAGLRPARSEEQRTEESEYREQSLREQG